MEDPGSRISFRCAKIFSSSSVLALSSETSMKKPSTVVLFVPSTVSKVRWMVRDKGQYRQTSSFKDHVHFCIKMTEIHAMFAGCVKMEPGGAQLASTWVSGSGKTYCARFHDECPASKLPLITTSTVVPRFSNSTWCAVGTSSSIEPREDCWDVLLIRMGLCYYIPEWVFAERIWCMLTLPRTYVTTISTQKVGGIEVMPV